eukprot:1743414-Pyramimonas_sp.AAC.1
MVRPRVRTQAPVGHDDQFFQVLQKLRLPRALAVLARPCVVFGIEVVEGVGDRLQRVRKWAGWPHFPM